MTISELTDELLDALGIAHDPAPASMNTAMDGATALTAPGPLDWGNARALPELESLLANVGYAAVFANDGSKISVVRLLRAGESVPTGALVDAEPFYLTSSLSVRHGAVVITSGRTRTTLIEERSLGVGAAHGDALVWVGFDDRTGRWLDATEWIAAYPGETTPGDIAAFRAGPSGTDATPQTMRAFGRLFTAVRLGAGEVEKCGRFVSLGEDTELESGRGLGRQSSVLYADVAVEIAAGQFHNHPLISGTDPQVRLDGVRALPGDGVFILPRDASFVRMNPGPNGGYGDAAELGGGQLYIIFAHEANEGDPDIDYFTTGYIAVNTAGTLSVAKMSAAELSAAISDPDVPKLEMPFLRRVMSWPGADAAPTPLNDTELEAVCEQIALRKLAAGVVQSGPIPLRGLQNIEPGTLSGAVSAVEWDLAGDMTRLFVNEHELPRSFYDAQAEAARRSVVAGNGRYSLPGSSAAISDVKSGSSPDDLGGGAVGGEPESAPATRGRDTSKPVRENVAPAPRPGETTPDKKGDSRRLARITARSAVGTNRWQYSWTEVYAVGLSGTDIVFDDVTGGAASATHGYAYNLHEINNDGSGVEGNGVNVDNLPAELSYQPVAIGDVVEIIGQFGDGSDNYWLFYGENAIDGEQTAPEGIGETWIEITGATEISEGTNRWGYDWNEVEPSGVGTFQDRPSGRDSTGDGLAYNTAEINNGPTGVQGNGVDVDTLPAGFSVQPVTVGWIGRAIGPYDDEGTAYWLFTSENGVDGECP